MQLGCRSCSCAESRTPARAPGAARKRLDLTWLPSYLVSQMGAGDLLKTARKGKATSFQAVRRGHAADTIFEQLAAAILTGELEAGAPLPPERILGEQFGVSRMVLRQAVHRLADVGLVRVRQGGATLVLDPGEAGDIRLIGLYYALDPGGERARTIRRDAIEKQSLQGLSLVDVCGRRGSLAEKQQLHDLALAFDEAG